MKIIQIRNVPDGTHQVLVRRAEEARQSLQEYLLSELNELARRPTLEELFRRIDQHTGGRSTGEEAVRILRAERDAR